MRKLLFSSFIMAVIIALFALCANAIAGTMIAIVGTNDESATQQNVAMVAPNGPSTSSAVIAIASGHVVPVEGMVSTTTDLPLPVARSPDTGSNFLSLETGDTANLETPAMARSPDATISGIGNNGMRLTTTNPA